MGALTEFQTVLGAECPTLDVYFISQKRAFDMRTIIKEAERILSRTHILDLDQGTIDDIREAGKCLAYEVPTAVCFHVFRAIERVGLKYFPILGVTEPKNRSLGILIDELKKLNVESKIIEILKHMKDNYRNPIIHPEEFVTNDQAADLFTFAISVIGIVLNDQNNEKKRRAPSCIAMRMRWAMYQAVL